jgi:hypothetical protein
MVRCDVQAARAATPPTGTGLAKNNGIDKMLGVVSIEIL